MDSLSNSISEDVRGVCCARCTLSRSQFSQAEDSNVLFVKTAACDLPA
jgi:hypothetical protein